MKPSPPDLGICKSAVCNVPGNTPVERYDGPGQFCPTCGELLQRYVPDPKSQQTPEPPPAVAPVPSAEPAAAPDAPAAKARPVMRRAMIAFSAAAAVALIVAGVSFVMADGFGSTVGVCRTSMSDRLARDVVASYAAKAHTAAAHFDVRTTNCDLNFATAGLALKRHADGGIVIGHDGVVAIVSPQNHVRELSVDQVRGIFSGKITNWSNVGGPNAPIVAYLPQEGSDESNAFSTAILHGERLGSGAARLPASSDVVRAVTAANGRNAIGIVAFSVAVPGKVVSMAPFVTPSTLSIAERRYPLTIDVTVAAKQSADPAVLDLFSYATSAGAKVVVARNGVLP